MPKKTAVKPKPKKEARKVVGKIVRKSLSRKSVKAVKKVALIAKEDKKPKLEDFKVKDIRPVDALFMPEGDYYWENRPLNDEKRDWEYHTDNWISDYWASGTHPHRHLIIDALKSIGFGSILEVGCNCGPNLRLIQQEFSGKYLAGIDINRDVVREARDIFPQANIQHGNANNLPFADQSIDVILSDAVLIYVAPGSIRQVLDEFNRVAKNAIVLLEWDSDSYYGELLNYHWSRDYKKLLEEYGFKVKKTKIKEKDWASKSWVEAGYLYVATR